MQIEGRKGATRMRIRQWVLGAALVMAGGIGGYVLRGAGSPASEVAGGSRAGTQGQFGQGGFQGRPGQGFGRTGATIIVEADTRLGSNWRMYVKKNFTPAPSFLHTPRAQWERL